MKKQKGKESMRAHQRMQELTIPALIGTMQAIIDVLDSRGAKIRDWDHKDKAVKRISVIAGKIYILAVKEKDM